jgi:BASS family bile acid:Na+ symporter
MAVVAAFWGIWHAISGLFLAAIMSRTEAAQ